MDYRQLGMGGGIVRRVFAHDTLHLLELLAGEEEAAEEGAERSKACRLNDVNIGYE